MKRLVLVAGAAVLALVLLVLVVHTPPFRRQVLRYTIAEVQRRYAIRIQAARLDYNLAALTLGLADVHISADRTPETPFFEAEYLSVALPTRTLTGVIAFDEIAIANGRVRVVRDSAGRMNLPDSSDTPSGEPAALDVARLTAPRLVVDVSDAQNDLALTIPGISLDLGRNDGRVAVNAPATLRIARKQTRVSALDGGASFDGRALKLSAVTVRADEAALSLDGTVSLLVSEPAIDLHAAGTADVARLAKWGIDEGALPTGTVALDVHAAGAFANPVADVRLTSEALSVPGGAAPGARLSLTNVAASSRVSSERLDLKEAHLSFAGGRLNATGQVPFSDAPAHLNADWEGLDVAALTTLLAGSAEVVPTGALSGELEASGPLPEISKWSAGVRLRTDGGVTRRGLVAIPGESRLQLTGGHWRIEARHRLGNTVPISLAAGGELNEQEIGRSTLNGRLDVADANLPPLLRLLRTVGIAEIDEDLISAGTVTAGVKLGGRLAAPVIDAELHALDVAGMQFSVGELRAHATGDIVAPKLSFTAEAPSAVAAEEQLADVRLAGALDGTLLTVEILAASQAVSAGRLALAGTYNLGDERYNAMVDLANWQLVPTPERPLAAQIDANLTGAGTISEPHAAGSIRATRVAWDGTSPGDLVADVRLDGEAANIDARAGDLNSRLTARVNVRAPYVTTAELRGDNIDLAKVIPPSSSPTPLTGRVSFTAHADAPLSEWRNGAARVEVTSLDAAAGDLPIRLTEPARLHFEGEQVYVDRFEATAGATRFSASGALPLSEGSGGLTLTADGDIGEAARAVEAAGLAMVPITEASGALTLRARVGGSLEKPVIAGDLAAGPGSASIQGLSTATDLRLRAHFENDVVQLLEAHTVYEGAVLDATGSIPLAVVNATAPRTDAPASLHATVRGVTPAVLRGVLDPAALEDLAGTVDLALNLEAPSSDLTTATGDLTLTRLDLQMAGLPVTQRVPTRIVARDGFARIESWNWSGQGATLGVFGQVRLADRQAAIIANGDIDLRVLTPFVRSAGLSTGGRLIPRLSITGPLDAPRIDGDLALNSGEVRLVDPRVVMTGLSARAALTRTELTLRELTGSINGGSLAGTGSVTYVPDAGLTAHLAADINDMAMDFPAGLRSQLNAALQLDAESAPDQTTPQGRLSGSITVVRGSYREPLAVVGGLLTTMRARRVAATAASEDTASLKQLDLDIRVQTDDDLVVDNNYARAQMAADLNLIGTAAAPGMSGRAVLREDGQLFVGRNVYTISRDAPSTIDFISPTAIEPVLNIHLTTRVAGHDIELALTGPAEGPQVDMTSEGLGQADITALLLTGRTLDQLGSTDAAFIGTQVIGNFSGEVLGFAGRAVGLDVLRLGGVEDSGTRLDANAVASEVDPTSRLTFGKSLGPNVDITFSQSLRVSTAQTWIVEYLPARQLDLRLVSRDDDLRTYGLRHDISLGGGSGATAQRRPAERVESRVAGVTINGQLAFPEDRIRSLLELKQGDRFDFGRWQDDRDRLEDFYHRNGRLTVKVNASRAANGDVVTLAYDIDAGPSTAVDVMGVDLGRAVQQQVADAWAASILDELLVEEATQIVRQAMFERGYPQAAITARVMSDGDTKTLRIEVRPGTRSTGTRVRIDVTDEALAADLRNRVEAQRLDQQVVRDPGAVTRDLTEFLRARGYLRASVKAAPPVYADGIATLPIAVDAGVPFVVAGVRVEGSRSVSVYDIERAANVDAGAPYDPVAIDVARERIVALYRSRGFPGAAVIANAAIRETEPRVDLTFEVDESLRQTVGDVAVSGNAGVDTDVVTRALGLVVGAPLEPTELLRARTRVFATGLFRRVDLTTEPMNRVSAADPVQPMRVRLTLEAWPALRVRYGFQAREEYSGATPTERRLAPGLSADVTRRTLFGRAVSLGGSVQYLRRENSGRALLNAPTLMSLPIESSLVLERVHHSIEGTTSVSNRNTVSWEQVVRSGSHTTLSYSYRFDRDHTFNTRPSPGSGLDFDITVNVARFITNAAWDTRDDPLDATRGSLFSSSVQWAPARLGSQFQFLKYVGQAYRFQNVRGVVLASAARLGLVRPLGGQELYVGELFFAGGSRTVRGVAENSLGERDFFGDPAGGAAMLVLNQEARVPIYKWIGGVVFIDAGNIYRQPKDLRLNRLTGSVGFGLRLSTPFALLRADYGRTVWPGSVSGPGRWVVGIGQAF